MRKRRLAVLISGRGSNMEALARAAQAPDYPAEIVLVASSKAGAAGLETAAALGLPTAIVPARDHPSRDSFDAALTVALEAHGTEAIALAGLGRPADRTSTFAFGSLRAPPLRSCACGAGSLGRNPEESHGPLIGAQAQLPTPRGSGSRSEPCWRRPLRG